MTPHANPVNFFWSIMACTGVPHIVLHVLCSTRTFGGQFRPSEVRFRAIFAVSSNLFYKTKTHFLQKGPFPPTTENLCVDSQTPPGPKYKGWQMGNSSPKKSLRHGVEDSPSMIFQVSAKYLWHQRQPFQNRIDTLPLYEQVKYRKPQFLVCVLPPYYYSPAINMRAWSLNGQPT